MVINRKWGLVLVIGVSLLLMILTVVACSSVGNSVPETEGEVSSTGIRTGTPGSATLPPSSFMPEIPRVSVHEAKAKLEEGEKVLIVNSCDTKEYDELHIKGAISMPLDTMQDPYDNVEGYDEIIPYGCCDDEQCSARAVQKFMEAGFDNVAAMDGGLDAWEEAGYPVESSSGILPQSSFMPEIPRISVDEVKARLERGEKIVIVDSRDTKYYDESHIEGAISLPLDEMAEPYDNFEGYDGIVTYCTCPDEESSARAAQKLMEAGFASVVTIEGGLDAWEAAGYPVEKTGLGGNNNG